MASFDCNLILDNGKLKGNNMHFVVEIDDEELASFTSEEDREGFIEQQLGEHAQQFVNLEWKEIGYRYV